MPTGVCGLCKQEKQLQESHLMPAALYKVIRDAAVADGASNVNPIVITPNIAIHASNQVKDYLLCFDCEQFLSEQGEKWMAENCWHADNDFPLRSLLEHSTPMTELRTGEFAYRSGEVAGLDRARLIHFTAGVFWRAAARQWSPTLGHPPLRLTLGPYKERRLFVKGEAPFPKRAALVVTVNADKTPGANEFAVFPYLRTPRSGFNQFMFCIPGIIFQMFLGGEVLLEVGHISIAHSPDHLIFLGSADFAGADMLRALKQATPKGSLAKDIME